MNDVDRTELKKRLLQYPGTTEDMADEQLYAYENREKENAAIMDGHRF